ncbi:hypothetical protein BN159_7728 [Streptomyces davaonensis JCM 4913]|uniref:Uncharacterized protein n=1 Tax=Streptomyces davaonensis (strain DSM 101723 / JCM 4913 / KCC S-0913 / 768) TaxID=1214101 RepID=K4RES6_STRDJ|nr:hypothetical protein BN159_7728 [Streptomyces davaonensis JCM 4913]
MSRSVLTAGNGGIHPVADCAFRQYGDTVPVVQRQDLLKPNTAATAVREVG